MTDTGTTTAVILSSFLIVPYKRQSPTFLKVCNLFTFNLILARCQFRLSSKLQSIWLSTTSVQVSIHRLSVIPWRVTLSESYVYKFNPNMWAVLLVVFGLSNKAYWFIITSLCKTTSICNIGTMFSGLRYPIEYVICDVGSAYI